MSGEKTIRYTKQNINYIRQDVGGEHESYSSIRIQKNADKNESWAKTEMKLDCSAYVYRKILSDEWHKSEVAVHFFFQIEFLAVKRQEK